MRLTIAIPTFDRNDLVADAVGRLLGQDERAFRLLVIDNCSPEPVERTLEAALGRETREKVTLVRNAVNIGGNANIVRCFELCETEWLWILGDDDVPADGCVRRILNAVEAHPTSVFHVFHRPATLEIPAYSETVGRDGLLKRIDDFTTYGTVGFLSTGVYRASRLKPFVKYGYHYAYTWYPHMAMLLMALGTDGVCSFVNEAIVADVNRAPSDQLWNWMHVSLGATAMLDLPLSQLARRKLQKVLRSGNRPSRFAVDLARRSLVEGDRHQNLYVFDQINYRLGFRDRSLVHRVNGRLWRLVVRYPEYAFPAIRLLSRLARPGVEPPSLPERMPESFR